MLLNAVENGAKLRGWLVVSETAAPGFVHRITAQHVPRLLRDFDPETVESSQYRLRLIAAELIEPTGRGYVDFALSYLREYLRNEAATEP